jgi:hypothetical protein
MRVSLHFEGWFQCRLATDPDPSDEPRGVSGSTFAVAGEPDLDRVLRLQPEGIVARLGGPNVGVSVTDVEVDGAAKHEHFLIGARVNLLGQPMFIGRNHLEADDGREPIRPFDLGIVKDDFVLSRRTVTQGIFGTPQATGVGGIDPSLAKRLGVADPHAFRLARLALLTKRLSAPDVTDTERAALKKRISDIDKPFDPGNPSIQEILLGMKMSFSFAINNLATISDPSNRLGGQADTAQEWPLDLWFGVWDADALCGFTQGRLDIPVL